MKNLIKKIYDLGIGFLIMITFSLIVGSLLTLYSYVGSIVGYDITLIATTVIIFIFLAAFLLR